MAHVLVASFPPAEMVHTGSTIINYDAAQDTAEDAKMIPYHSLQGGLTLMGLGLALHQSKSNKKRSFGYNVTRYK